MEQTLQRLYVFYNGTEFLKTFYVGGDKGKSSTTPMGLGTPKNIKLLSQFLRGHLVWRVSSFLINERANKGNLIVWQPEYCVWLRIGILSPIPENVIKLCLAMHGNILIFNIFTETT